LEMKRLREGTGSMLPYPGLLGSLIASDMRLPLKPEFMAKLGTSHGRLLLFVSFGHFIFTVHYFCFLISSYSALSHPLKFALSHCAKLNYTFCKKQLILCRISFIHLMNRSRKSYIAAIWTVIPELIFSFKSLCCHLICKQMIVL